MDTLSSPVTLSSKLEEPIRAELFGIERLEQHAESLAAAQIVTGDARRGQLLTPILQKALKRKCPSIIDCPVDYGEKLRMTEHLKLVP